MKISIELTEDQIQRITTSLLSRLQTPELPAEPKIVSCVPVSVFPFPGKQKTIDRILGAVHQMPRHGPFPIGAVAHASGLETKKCSNPMTKLAQRGYVKMICRGTWERLK